MTLYYYTKDADGVSVCYGNCEKSWPSLLSRRPSRCLRAPGIRVRDHHPDRRNEAVHLPRVAAVLLARDAKPGDTAGEGLNKVWYIMKVPAYTVMISTSDTLGNYLVDGEGRTCTGTPRTAPA